MLKEHLTL
uniref:Uncharacterized protein n=1 Tax=Moniliophthora roreri TaxID=221103 RepID=A0A0W0G1B1_MONRR